MRSMLTFVEAGAAHCLVRSDRFLRRVPSAQDFQQPVVEALHANAQAG